jgi:hypothetical protein
VGTCRGDECVGGNWANMGIGNKVKTSKSNRMCRTFFTNNSFQDKR